GRRSGAKPAKRRPSRDPRRSALDRAQTFRSPPGGGGGVDAAAGSDVSSVRVGGTERHFNQICDHILRSHLDNASPDARRTVVPKADVQEVAVAGDWGDGASVSSPW